MRIIVNQKVSPDMNSVWDKCPILVRLYSNTNMFNLSSPKGTKPYLH